MSEIRANAEKWLNSNIDEETRKKIIEMLNSEDDSALTEAFYKDLEFGTGGLRGIMGTGSNYMNRYTVGMATQGLANYLLNQFPEDEIKVVISHDSRNNSRYFAETTAAVFSANKIKVYLFKDLRPTPELSFAIRHLGCHAGVMITASHNPKEYNGYKAYWKDGAQLIAPHDKNVISEVRKIALIDNIKFNKKDELIELIGDEIDEAYLSKVAELSLAPEIVEEQKDLSIVYSSIHGTGINMVPPCLRRYGFENVTIVEEQATPDGNFSTVVYPNPEEAEALDLALKKAREIDAELVMATDPDADRVGIAVKDDTNEWILLNGNQTASLLLYYVLTKYKEKGLLRNDHFIVKTIVTTDLINEMAEALGVTCYETLTGFKYIADVIRNKEGQEEYIAGGEESYGYLIGDFVRDKDAVSACAMIAEMAAYAKHNGKSVYGLLQEIYQKFGYYQESLVSVTKKGKKGAEEIKMMMDNFRNNPPEELGGEKIIQMRDYKTLVETDLTSGSKTKLDFPVSDVLQFYTDKGTKISVRPSGTEPKIKFYVSAVDKGGENSAQRIKERIKTIENELNKQ